jgi:hypothetical protein
LLRFLGGSASVADEYVGVFNATTGGGKPISIEIPSDDHSYYFCDQDMIQFRPPTFPAIPSNQPAGHEWMSTEQGFALLYGFTAVAVIICVVLIFLNGLRKRWQGLILSPFVVRNRGSPIVKRKMASTKNNGTHSILFLLAQIVTPEAVVPQEL